MSDITALLDELIGGDVDLLEVADAFRTRSWPRAVRDTPKDVTELYAADLADPAPEPEGSFAEVAAYFAAGKITAGQYTDLAEAAAQAMHDAPPPGTPAGAVNEGTS